MLAIAPIFGLDKADFIETNPDERMVLLRKSLADIPSGLIFQEGKRLKTPGFRWAPRSWMNGRPPDFPGALLNDNLSQLPEGYTVVLASSVLMQRGLLVRYPGYRLFQPQGVGKWNLSFAFQVPGTFSVDRGLRQ